MNTRAAPIHQPRALVAYATTHGHTAKIAARFGAAMRGDGVEVDVCDVAQIADLEPSGYDTVVVGGSLHREHHQTELVDWVVRNRGALDRLPSVFFSVSLSAAGDTGEPRADAQRCIDRFSEHTGWTPTRTEPIAGCLQYREYDAFTRQLMRLLMHRMGQPTDSSHDWDFTDWAAIDRLGHEIAALSGALVAV